MGTQMKEREALKQAEQQEELEYARQEQAALQAWEAAEAERKRLQHEIALKLKQEREAQLVDKNARRNNVSRKHQLWRGTRRQGQQGRRRAQHLAVCVPRLMCAAGLCQGAGRGGGHGVQDCLRDQARVRKGGEPAPG